MQNLWYYSAAYIDRSINGDELNEDYNMASVQAYEDGDEALSEDEPKK